MPATSTIYAARPTLRLSGQEDVRASNLITALAVEEQEGGQSALELRLTNVASLEGGGAELAFGADARLQLGKDITVYLGQEDSPREVFRGLVSALEWRFGPDSAPELVVLAEDALQRARLARRSATYADSTPADVVRSVASRLGLRPVLTGLDSPSATWAQLNESDLAFLRRLLAPLDADLQIVGEELHVSPRGDVRRGALTLDLADKLIAARVVADLSEQATQVTVRGWNAADGRAVEASISSGAHLGPGQGRSGAQVLRDTLGERHEHLAHVSVGTQDEARAVAQAAFDLRARRFLRVEGQAVGDAQLRVGTHLTLAGLEPRLDNTYYVVRARHAWDRVRGYFTEFGAECAWLGA
jgi:phage protein D